jgi:cystathionine beta-lyase/cystathionine gamma-synthase
MSLKKQNETNYSIPTRLMYGEANAEEWNYSYHVVPPITASSTFRLGSAQRGAQGFSEIGQATAKGVTDPIYVYDRMGEPNNDMLQHILATAEQGDCAVAFASGMAAVAAATGIFLSSGSEIISHRMIYGCSYSLFTNAYAKNGVKTHFADLTSPENLRSLINENSRLVYLESPVNPSMELLDLPAIVAVIKDINSKRPKDKQVISVIDNTFATPVCQRPLTLGIDVVLHSMTKAISGFGIEMGGAVITRKEFFDQLILHRKDYGAVLAPTTAWSIMAHGMPTLELRIQRQQQNAKKVADFLEQHPGVKFVRYPGLPSFPQYELAKRQMLDYEGNFAPGNMLYFALKGANPEESMRRGEKMMNYIADNSYCVTLAVSLGQIRTLIEHPGSMTHSSYSAEEQVKRGMDPGGIRISVGIERVDDIIMDLEEALKNLD